MSHLSFIISPSNNKQLIPNTQPAILIRNQLRVLPARPGEQNPQLVAAQARRRQACAATNLHNENC